MMKLSTIWTKIIDSLKRKCFHFSDSCVCCNDDTNTTSNFIYNKIDLSIQTENKNGSDTRSCSVVRKAPTNYRYFHNGAIKWILMNIDRSCRIIILYTHINNKKELYIFFIYFIAENLIFNKNRMVVDIIWLYILMFTFKTCGTRCLFSCWIVCVLVNYKNYTI